MRRSLSFSVAWYSAGNIFIRAASFILLPLYSNVITPSDYGIYSVIMSFYTVASVLFQGGLQSALTKYYIEREEKNEIFSVIMNVVISWGAVLLLGVFIFAPLISSLLLDTKEYSGLLRLITFSLYIETIVFFILHLFKTKEESVQAVVYTSAGALLNIILNIIFVYSWKEGISGIIKAQLYSSVLTLLILIPYFQSNYKFDLNRFFKTSFFRPLFLFSIPVFLSGLFSSFVDVADRFIINDVLGERQTGIYSFSYRIALIMNIFVIAFRTAFTPYAINLFPSKDYSKKFGKILLNLISAGGLILLTVSFLADDLFDIRLAGNYLFSENYRNGLIILPYVLAGYLFSSIMSFFSVYPYISGKSYHFLISDALSFLVNILMNFILIPSAGITGAAIATMFAFMTGAVYLFIISRSGIKVDYRRKELLILFSAIIIILNIGLYFNNIFIDILLAGIYIGIVILFGGASINLLKLKSVYKAD